MCRYFHPFSSHTCSQRTSSSSNDAEHKKQSKYPLMEPTPFHASGSGDLRCNGSSCSLPPKGDCLSHHLSNRWGEGTRVSPLANGRGSAVRQHGFNFRLLVTLILSFMCVYLCLFTYLYLVLYFLMFAYIILFIYHILYILISITIGVVHLRRLAVYIAKLQFCLFVIHLLLFMFVSNCTIIIIIIIKIKNIKKFF